MAIARKPKPAKQPDEATVQQLISKGGSVAAPTQPDTDEEELVPVLVRMPKGMRTRIAAAVMRRRPVRISRHSWIIEKLQDALDREETGGESE
jgi:hypothetical protein